MPLVILDFFFGHTWFEQEGEWPFKQWSHGDKETFEFYRELIGVTDAQAVIRYGRVLSYPRFKGHILSTCGSNARHGDCCHERVSRLRTTVDPISAKCSLKALEAIQGLARRRQKRPGSQLSIDKIRHCPVQDAIVIRSGDVSDNADQLNLIGAQGETRTRTPVRTRRPERRASTNSATWAGKVRTITSFFAGGALYSLVTNSVNRRGFPEGRK